MALPICCGFAPGVGLVIGVSAAVSARPNAHDVNARSVQHVAQVRWALRDALGLYVSTGALRVRACCHFLRRQRAASTAVV